MQVISKKGAKPLTQLKNIHNEHYARLQAKHAAESDLLDDVRLYCKQRAAIERDYGQALQKLTNGLLCKKELAGALSNDKECSNGRSVWHVWRCLLEESNDLALARIRLGDAQQRLHSELKPLKIQRAAACKRVFEQLRILQSDLSACVHEMVKSHKVYAEEENHAKETRLKAMATEEKIRRRSTNVFNTMAQLHRNYEKLLIRRHAYDARSATARNEYLFQLAAINAHLKHYFTKDLPTLAKMLDGELYDKLSSAFVALAQQESELSEHTKKCFLQISTDSSEISRAFAWESFLKSCPLFDKTVQYQFEPMEGDQNTLLRSPDSKEANLEQIARKLARRLVIRERRIKSYETELKTLQGGCVALHPNIQPNPASPGFENNEDLLAFNQEYVEHKVEEVQFAIRREEIERVKIEACLSLLRNSTVEVKQFILEARAAADAAAEAALAQQLREVNGDLLQTTAALNETQQQGLDIRPAGEGSSDSVDSGRPVGYGTDHRSCHGTQFGSQYSFGFSYPTCGYNRANEIRISTGPRPATIGQVANRLADSSNKTCDVNGTNHDSQSETWNSLTSSRHSSHDYQNVNSSRDMPRQTMDDCIVRRRRHPGPASSSQPRRGASSDALHDEEDIDLEIVWSEHGRLRQATVLHEFRAKRPDELDLVVHETVALLDNHDENGWIKVRSLIDGNEGLVPISFLRLHESPVTAKNKNAAFSNQSVEIETSLGDGIQNSNDESSTLSVPTKTEFYVNFGSPSRYHSAEHNVKPLNSSSINQTSHSATTTVIQSCESMVLPVSDTVAADEKSTKIAPIPGMFVRTLIEFEGCNPDELSFAPGCVIRVLGRAPIPVTDRLRTGENGFRTSPNSSDRMDASISSAVDDGWWEGELITASSEIFGATQTYKRLRGVFPSMLVQIMSSNDCESWSKIWEHASPMVDKCWSETSSKADVPHSVPDSSHKKMLETNVSTSVNCPEAKNDRKAIRRSTADCQNQSDEDYIQWNAHLSSEHQPMLESSQMEHASEQSTCSYGGSTSDRIRQSSQDEVLQIAEL